MPKANPSSDFSMSSARPGSALLYWIDHTARCPVNTGMQRVVRTLARALVDAAHEILFVVWDPQLPGLRLASEEAVLHLGKFGGPQLSKELLSVYSRRGGEPVGDLAGRMLLVPEVTHITYHDSPPTLALLQFAHDSGLRTGFIFYDAIPLKLAEYQAVAPVHAEYMRHLWQADVVLTISEFVAADLRRFFACELMADARTSPPVLAVPLAGEVIGQPRVLQLSKGATEPIRILSVGTIEPRKNQLELARAVVRLNMQRGRNALRLTLVGNLHPLVAAEIQQICASGKGVDWRGHVDDDELRRLYERCAFTVFPSIEEGFGLPILESLWYGKPCLCADYGAMAEVAAGGGCLMVDMRQPAELERGLRLLSEDSSVRDRLSSEAVSRPIRSWSEYAHHVVAALHAPSNKLSRRPVLFWVDHTAGYPSNSGIQRVVRSLGRVLQEGADLIAVRWDSQSQTFTGANEVELAHLAQWSGPHANRWLPFSDAAAAKAAWLLVPELTTYHGAPSLEAVVSAAKLRGLKTAIVFYDAIPYKLVDLYPVEARRAHEAYMRSLVGFDRVFAISEASCEDLRAYWRQSAPRLIGAEDKLVAIPLPAEFPASARCLQPHELSEAPQPVRLLSVGTLEPRKNHRLLLRAFLAACRRSERPLELVLAGGAPFAEIRAEVEKLTKAHANIRWVGHVEDEALASLYASCDFTIYPSLEEGFGLPILESLWYGHPCICADHGAIAEVAQGGGCLMVDTRSEAALTDAMLALSGNRELYRRLSAEALSRSFQSWQDYGAAVLDQLRQAEGDPQPLALGSASPCAPLLSLCISTYNRAPWLEVSLAQAVRLTEPYRDVIEIVVCDNASTDATEAVCAKFLDVPNLRYVRNRNNVGMLGNLRVTANEACGQYVWIIGDDDIIYPGALERILAALIDHFGIALVYLNYSYTRLDAPTSIDDIDAFLAGATPISPPGPDQLATIAQLAPLSENFFTAIYCLVLRRDHAIKAYSQDTSGRPFSTMPSCIPTSHHVCNHMFDLDGYWIGSPAIAVNMNVSWGKYAPLWILERIPELHEVSECRGAEPAAMDRWRAHNLPGALHFLEVIYGNDLEGNAAYFSFARFLRRHKHMPEFRALLPQFIALYKRARKAGKPGTTETADELLSRFGLSNIATEGRAALEA